MTNHLATCPNPAWRERRGRALIAAGLVAIGIVTGILPGYFTWGVSRDLSVYTRFENEFRLHDAYAPPVAFAASYSGPVENGDRLYHEYRIEGVLIGDASRQLVVRVPASNRAGPAVITESSEPAADIAPAHVCVYWTEASTRLSIFSPRPRPPIEASVGCEHNLFIGLVRAQPEDAPPDVFFAIPTFGGAPRTGDSHRPTWISIGGAAARRRSR